MKRVSFCDQWEFSRDEEPFEPVIVPHDAMLDNKRAADAPAGSASGYYYGARYRYRKSLELDESQAARRLMLEFEGVYRDARVHVNGAEVSVPPYGFVPFFVDLTGFVRAGVNAIEVEADNSAQPDCRWYSGGGLYRPVWLWEGGEPGAEPSIDPEGVTVTTISLDPATVHVQVRMANCGGSDCGARQREAAGCAAEDCGAADCGVADERVQVSIVDSGGVVVASGVGCSLDLVVPDAALWDADHPYRYRCLVEVLDRPRGARHARHAKLGDETREVLDTASVSFGIRLVEWSSRGLFVNGREVLLRGGCIHCDNGILGAASWPESERRRVLLLKQAGFNAVRVAHNPAPSALLEACDEIGMYVMDEAWDMWFMRKNPHDYARHFLGWCDFDLRRLVAHDYNHPSVIMYSIGNEIADPITEEGVELERSMVAYMHALDPTRPVTCGFNLTMMVMERIGRGWYAQKDGDAEASLVNADDEPPRGSLLFNLVAQATGSGMTLIANAPGADALVSPALDALDIAGYNYASARYAVDARKHPGRIVVGSETFPYELPKNWRLVERLPNLVGDFMWAAWDYLGEAGAGAWAYTPEEAGFSKPWPWLIAGSGALDILGHPNAHAALAGAVWHTAKGPSIQVRPVSIMEGQTFKATWRGSDAIPSWSWRGCEGVVAEVEVYDGCAHAVRLELNGRSVGVARVRNYVARFKLAYQPGTLVAVALDAQGKELARSGLVSAEGSLRLSLQPEMLPVLEARSASLPDGLARFGGGRIAYVPLAIVGENGQVESNADELVRIQVEGGTLLAFGSARPATEERFTSGCATTYRGQAMAIVYRETPGSVVVTASSETLAPVSAVVELR